MAFNHISSNFVKLPRFLRFLGPSYWVQAYYRKFKPTEEMSPFLAQELIDYTVWSWILSGARWVLGVSVSGLVLWYVIKTLLFPIPVYTFFAWGTFAWILAKSKPRWW